jgi:hypothetical protein
VLLDDDYEPRERWLEPWELVGLAGVLPSHRMAIVAFAVATGSELGAWTKAKRGDVRADYRGAQIHGTKRETRDRFAPAPLPGQQALLKWALAHAEPGRDGLLFSPWTNVRRDLGEACKELGIAHMSTNDLRRTYGTWLRMAGVPVDLIARGMGHADSRQLGVSDAMMVQRVYGRVDDADVLLRLMEMWIDRAKGGGPTSNAPPTAPATLTQGPPPTPPSGLSAGSDTSDGLKIPVSAVRFRLWALRIQPNRRRKAPLAHRAHSQRWSMVGLVCQGHRPLAGQQKCPALRSLRRAGERATGFRRGAASPPVPPPKSSRSVTAPSRPTSCGRRRVRPFASRRAPSPERVDRSLRPGLARRSSASPQTARRALLRPWERHARSRRMAPRAHRDGRRW